MSSDRIPDTLIVGGGLGGLSAALCIARQGGTVNVLERSKSFAEVGAGIQLAPNATRILQRLGVLKAILPLAVRPRRLVLGDAVQSRELTSLDLTDFPARYGAPYLVLHRNDLLTALVDACARSGVRLCTDVNVVELTDTGPAAVAVCADGREFSAEIAIGADGLHSRLRGYFSDDQPINSGFGAYRGAIPMDQVERHADLRDVVAWIGPGLHLVQYPLRSGQMYNQVAVFRSQAYLRGEAGWGTRAELRAALAGCSEHVRESLKRLSIASRWPMLDRLPMANWARGRVALLGDAAHPMLQYLAQGACQAIEDADALAAELAAAGEAGLPVSNGLAGYAARRAPRAIRVQRTARTWGDIWHVDGVAKLLRDELLLDRDVADHKHVKWLYGEDAVTPEPGQGRTERHGHRGTRDRGDCPGQPGTRGERPVRHGVGSRVHPRSAGTRHLDEGRGMVLRRGDPRQGPAGHAGRRGAGRQRAAAHRVPHPHRGDDRQAGRRHRRAHPRPGCGLVRRAGPAAAGHLSRRGRVRRAADRPLHPNRQPDQLCRAGQGTRRDDRRRGRLPDPPARARDRWARCRHGGDARGPACGGMRGPAE